MVLLDALKAELVEAEIAALDGDFSDRLHAAYALSTEMLELAEAGERVDPEQWQFLRDWLDDNIARLELAIAAA